MKSKILNACGWIAVLSLVIVSCKKEDKAKKDALNGAWVETPLQAFSRTIRFASAGKFTMEYIEMGNSTKHTSNGTYTIKGDSLKVNIQEMVEQQSSGLVVRTPVSTTLFDKGTFTIMDNVLTINFISYPADGPVPGQLKFKAQ